MKRYITFILAILLVIPWLQAQVSTQNYIRTRTMLNSTGSQYLDDIEYYDGLGRPFEHVQKGITPAKANLLYLTEYDACSRESHLWLPVEVTNEYTPSSDSFKAQIENFYDGDKRPLNEPIYESSPLNRIVKRNAPGEKWKNNPVLTEYLCNAESSPLHCIRYSVTSSGNLAKGNDYAAKKLYVNKVTDEDGHITYTFTDIRERTLLVRQMQDGVCHDTYYVYDDFNNLRFVLSPMYQENANLDLYAFQYKYDECNRCVEMKSPGCQPIKYVFDKADNLVFSQDGVQRGKSPQEWTFYLYDVFHRMVMQGTCTNTNTASAANQVLTTSFSSSGSSLENSGYKSTFSYVTPVISQINYYDTYYFRSLTGFNNSNFPDKTASGSGSLTGKVVSLTGATNTRLYSAIYYDDKGRPVKSVSGNNLGGYDISDMTYTFTDKPLTTQHVHSATGKSTLTENYTYNYDHADRLQSVSYKLGNNAVITLSENVYDKLGRLQMKKIGSSVHNTTYEYNIRNWLTSISGNKFTETLYYNYGMSNSPCYNGNLSSVGWKSGTETITRGFRFSYDELNRLTVAQYGENSGFYAFPDRFTEKITQYDKNGNIKHLQRYGLTGADTYGLVDDLTIGHTGNQLKYVNDAVTAAPYGTGINFINGSNTTATEYVYDANGNLTQDLNKKISKIQYNTLNLPLSVQFSTGGKVDYVYGADGVKHKVIRQSGSTTATTDYCGNVIYENGVLSKILTDEGYVTLSGTTPTYHYFLKDHLGNTRVVINNNGTIEQENHYYPFGGTFGIGTATSNQPYKFGGKELDKTIGLNWYDFEARNYDPELGRFVTGDPMAEKYYGVSQYTYCMNNPIKYIDPDGKKIVIGTFWQRFMGALGLDSYVAKVKKQFEQNNMDSRHIETVYNRLEESDLIFKVLPLTNSSVYNPRKKGNHVIANSEIEFGKKQGGTLFFDPDMQITPGGTYRNPRIGLAHETGHLEDLMNGTAIRIDQKKVLIKDKTEIYKLELNESNSVALENIIRGILNYPIRNQYLKKDEKK